LNTHYKDWLAQLDLNTSITVTLKKAVEDERGYWSPLDRHRLLVTACKLRDRFIRKLVGRANFDKGERLPFLVFYEVGQFDQRPHIHILTNKPDKFNDIEYRTHLTNTAIKLDYIYNHIQIQPIQYSQYSSKDYALNYCLKTGTEAFLPEASFYASIH
jgi:hypothetical protein